MAESREQLVRIHMMNQNVYPAACEDLLAALPIRAIRDIMDGNHTAFFNSRAEDAARAVSHKVQTEDDTASHGKQEDRF